MLDNIVFLVTTTKDKGKGKSNYRSEVNSHLATVRHAKRRNLIRSYYLQPGQGDPMPQIRNGLNDQKAVNNYVDFREPPLPTTWADLRTRAGEAPCLELEPPIRWPVEFTSYEKSLIHFCLDEGRQFSLSEGPTPSYSLASDWANRFLESTKIYSICHVVVSEQFLYQVHGRRPTRVFYARQAHAYRLMQDMLDSNNKSSTCDDKLLAFTQVIIMDLILGKHEVRLQHARAVDEYIELCGGLRHILAMPRDPRSALDPWRFVLSLCYIEWPTPSYPRTQALIARFLDNLRCIRQWANASRSEEQGDAVSRFEARCAVSTVRDYVLWGFNYCWRGTEKRYFADGASLCFIFILCLAQAKYKYSTTETLRFFKNLAPRVAQRNRPGSIAMFPRPHPMSAISSMAYIRDDIMFNKATEATLCEATVDLVRFASLLPVSTMTMLAETWIYRSFQMAGFPFVRSTVNVETFSEDFLWGVEREVWTAWRSASHAGILE